MKASLSLTNISVGIRALLAIGLCSLNLGLSIPQGAKGRFPEGISARRLTAVGRFETDVSAITAPLALAGPSLASLEPLFERLA
jgi:hypothetical protein